ncbi:MAG: hypothetical protein ACRBB4_15745 [Neptuniibacter sp.]
MDLKQLESEIISQISLNLEDSKEKVPVITGSTGVFKGISGFDSLRAMELLVTLESVYDQEFLPEKVFVRRPPSATTVSDMAKAMQKIIEETE